MLLEKEFAKQSSVLCRNTQTSTVHLCDAAHRMKLEKVKTRAVCRRALGLFPPSIASFGGCSSLGAAEVTGDASLREGR